MESWAENKRLISVKPQAKSFVFCFNFSFLIPNQKIWRLCK
jgi:hypothetical protein